MYRATNVESEDVKTTGRTENVVQQENTINTAITEKAAPLLNSPIQTILWTKVVELCYSLPDEIVPINTDDDATVTNGTRTTRRSKCFHCCTIETETTFKLCGQCQVAKYCCRDCQRLDWKKQHKRACPSYQRMVYQNVMNNSDENDDLKKVSSDATGSTNSYHWVLQSVEIKCNARDEFFAKIRFYVCPYAVIRYMELGRGFLFLQTNHTLDVISLSVPIDCDGYPVVGGVRSCSVHYLTSGEYDQEVCRDDFEMTIMRQELHDAIARYDPMNQIVVLMRFRCGHVALGTTALVPDYKLCQHLGRDYYNPSTNNPIGCLQLNIDE